MTLINYDLFFADIFLNCLLEEVLTWYKMVSVNKDGAHGFEQLIKREVSHNTLVTHITQDCPKTFYILERLKFESLKL